jgi:hypothetical protein
MLTATLVMAMSLRVPDAKGHLNYRAIPKDGADAVVAVCGPTSAPVHCAAVLVTLAFRESGNNPEARHDHDKGCGAWGVLCTYPHATWLDQAKAAWSLVTDSAVKCPEPLAMYASGSCSRGLAVAREYMRCARTIAAWAEGQDATTTDTPRPR